MADRGRHPPQWVRWDKLDAIRKTHGWTWAFVARRSWYRESHLSEVRHGHRPETWTLILGLARAFMVNYDFFLKHPVYDMDEAEFHRRRFDHLDDGRPWPTRTGEEGRTLGSPYQQHQRAQQLSADVEWLEGKGGA